MQLKWHKNLTPKKWQEYTKDKQILSIAAELIRAKNLLLWKKNNEVKQSYERAFELLDLTIEDYNWQHGLKEILRFREAMGELYLKPNLKLNEKLLNILLTLTPGSYNLYH